ncbi:40S ribosomal protein SA [Plecturocebus cupreus]
MVLFWIPVYIYKRKSDGIYIINLKRTWEKLLLAAGAIVAIENPADVSVISSRNTSQRAVLKFAAAAGATPIAAASLLKPSLTRSRQPSGSHSFLWLLTPGLTISLSQRHVNLPPTALCNTDSPLCYVDIAILCNNKGAHSVGSMWWMLAQEVLHMCGTISCEHPWAVMPDLYFYRDPEEIEKEEQAEFPMRKSRMNFQ